MSELQEQHQPFYHERLRDKWLRAQEVDAAVREGLRRRALTFRQTLKEYLHDQASDWGRCHITNPLWWEGTPQALKHILEVWREQHA